MPEAISPDVEAAPSPDARPGRSVAYAALTALWIAVALATIKWSIAFYFEMSSFVMDEAGRRWYHSVMGGGSWFVGLASLVAAAFVVRLAWMSKSDRRLIYVVCFMVVGFSMFAVLLTHGAWMIPVKGITLFLPRMEKWGVFYLAVTIVVLIVRPENLASPLYGAVIAFSTCSRADVAPVGAGGSILPHLTRNADGGRDRPVAAATGVRRSSAG